MKIEAKKDFELNGVDYFIGDEVKTTDIKTIAKLNELGFIKPLTRKDFKILSNKGGEE